MTTAELASRLRVAASQPEGILRASVRGLAAELEAEAKPPVPGACDPACPVCNATIPDPIVAGQRLQPEPSVESLAPRVEALERANDRVAKTMRELREWVERWEAEISSPPPAYRMPTKSVSLVPNIPAERLVAELAATPAGAYLIAHGKRPMVDFGFDNAVEVANDLAFDLEVERKISEGVWFGDCDCRGWDGKSNRCDCGSRRASWVQGESHSFEKPCVYAEAH